MIGVALFLVTAGNVLSVARAALLRAGPEARPLLVAFVFGFLALLVSIFFGNFYEAWLYVWGFVGISLRLAVSEAGAEPTIVQDRARGPAAGRDDKTTRRAGRPKARITPGHNRNPRAPGFTRART